MEYEAIEGLRERHPAWWLLCAGHAPLILGFLGEHYVDGNQGATAAKVLVSRLDDYL